MCGLWLQKKQEVERNVVDDKHQFHGSFQQDMRLSFRKAVKLAAVLAILLLVNILVRFKLPVVSYSKSEKLLRHFNFDHDNGEPLENGSQLHALAGLVSLSRQQRSAKSLPRPSLVDRLGHGMADIHTYNPGARKKKLSTELAHSQRLSHDQPTELADIFVSVKTSGKFHASRLQLVLHTWYLLAKEQVPYSLPLSLSSLDDYSMY